MSQLLTQSPSLSLWYHLSRESPLQVSEDQPLYVGDYVVNFERRGDLYKYSLSTAQHGGESLLPQSTKVGFFDSALSMIIVRATLLDILDKIANPEYLEKNKALAEELETASKQIINNYNIKNSGATAYNGNINIQGGENAAGRDVINKNKKKGFFNWLFNK